MKSKLMIAIEEKRHWRIKYHDLLTEKEDEIRALKHNMKRMCDICELQHGGFKMKTRSQIKEKIDEVIKEMEKTRKNAHVDNVLIYSDEVKSQWKFFNEI